MGDRYNSRDVSGGGPVLPPRHGKQRIKGSNIGPPLQSELMPVGDGFGFVRFVWRWQESASARNNLVDFAGWIWYSKYNIF